MLIISVINSEKIDKARGRNNEHVNVSVRPPKYNCLSKRSSFRKLSYASVSTIYIYKYKRRNGFIMYIRRTRERRRVFEIDNNLSVKKNDGGGTAF